MRVLVPVLAIALFVAACDTASPAGERSSPVSSPSPTSIMSPTSPAVCAPPDDAPPDAAPVFCADTSPMQAARVLKIVDGDTLDVLLDGREERVRVFGIDTPERGQPCFREASDRLEALADSQVLLRPDVRDRDRYGRLLRYLYTPDGRSIDAAMIAEGFAHAWTDDGALRDPLVALEAHAAGSRNGCLWKLGARSNLLVVRSRRRA